jgi:hypothetical protein
VRLLFRSRLSRRRWTWPGFVLNTIRLCPMHGCKAPDSS